MSRGSHRTSQMWSQTRQMGSPAGQAPQAVSPREWGDVNCSIGLNVKLELIYINDKPALSRNEGVHHCTKAVCMASAGVSSARPGGLLSCLKPPGPISWGPAGCALTRHHTPQAFPKLPPRFGAVAPDASCPFVFCQTSRET